MYKDNSNGNFKQTISPEIRKLMNEKRNGFLTGGVKYCLSDDDYDPNEDNIKDAWNKNKSPVRKD